MKANVLDMIRHEFGHALVNLYPGALKKGGLFRKAFGGAYGEDPAEECVAAGWETAMSPNTPRPLRRRTCRDLQVLHPHPARVGKRYGTGNVP